MELINATRMVAGYTMGMDPEGHEYLVVVVKGTFDIPPNGGTPGLSEVQQPLIAADTFTGEPGFSAPVYESEFCLTKPMCDVLVIGNAYAPRGKPAPYTRVGLTAGPISKFIDVLGNRTWSGQGATPSEPEPFEQLPVSYDRAYGGVDNSNRDKATAYTQNPVGLGYRPLMSRENLRRELVPNTQEPGNPIDSPSGQYKPMSFGPVGRSWSPRLAYAGTYDEAWLEQTFPFLPRNFDTRYYQSAPIDQQMPYPSGGEPVSLSNMSAGGRLEFSIPSVDVPVAFLQRKRGRVERHAQLDTILIDPERMQLALTWRANVRLKRNILEIPQIVVGQMSRGWWRAKETGKSYFQSLVKSKNSTDSEANG